MQSIAKDLTYRRAPTDQLSRNLFTKLPPRPVQKTRHTSVAKSTPFFMPLEPSEQTGQTQEHLADDSRVASALLPPPEASQTDKRSRRLRKAIAIRQRQIHRSTRLSRQSSKAAFCFCMEETAISERSFPHHFPRILRTLNRTFCLRQLVD